MSIASLPRQLTGGRNLSLHRQPSLPSGRSSGHLTKALHPPHGGLTGGRNNSLPIQPPPQSAGPAAHHTKAARPRRGVTGKSSASFPRQLLLPSAVSSGHRTKALRPRHEGVAEGGSNVSLPNQPSLQSAGSSGHPTKAASPPGGETRRKISSHLQQVPVERIFFLPRQLLIPSAGPAAHLTNATCPPGRVTGGCTVFLPQQQPGGCTVFLPQHITRGCTVFLPPPSSPLGLKGPMELNSTNTEPTAEINYTLTVGKLFLFPRRHNHTHTPWEDRDCNLLQTKGSVEETADLLHLKLHIHIPQPKLHPATRPVSFGGATTTNIQSERGRLLTRLLRAKNTPLSANINSILLEIHLQLSLIIHLKPITNCCTISFRIMEEKPSSSIVHQMHWIADGGEDSSWRLKTMLHDRVNNNSLRRPVPTRLLTVSKQTRTNNAAVRHHATGSNLSCTPTERHITARIPNLQLSRLRRDQARRRRKKEIGHSSRYSPKYLAASALHFEPAPGRRRRRKAQHTSQSRTSPDIKDASSLPLHTNQHLVNDPAKAYSWKRRSLFKSSLPELALVSNQRITTPETSNDTQLQEIHKERDPLINQSTD